MLPRIEREGVSEVPYEVLLALDKLQPMVSARRRIEEGRYDPEDSDAVYSLWMAAYENQDMAEQARYRALERLVNRRCGKR